MQILEYSDESEIAIEVERQYAPEKGDDSAVDLSSVVITDSIP